MEADSLHAAARSTGRSVADAGRTAAAWQYALSVVYPTVALRRLGLHKPLRLGTRPPVPAGPGLGPSFSLRHPLPELDEPRGEVRARLDELAEVTEREQGVIQPFCRPLLEETARVLEPYLTPRARVLDVTAGLGCEPCWLSERVPEGEVVVAHPSARMVRHAFEGARAAGIGRMAFFRAELGFLPAAFHGAFDVLVGQLAFHGADERPRVRSDLEQALRPGGLACVLDSQPPWAFAPPGTRAAGKRPDGERGELYRLLVEGGFSVVFTEELLPGVDLVMARR